MRVGGQVSDGGVMSKFSFSKDPSGYNLGVSFV